MQGRLSGEPGDGIERHARLTPGIDSVAYALAGVPQAVCGLSGCGRAMISDGAFEVGVVIVAHDRTPPGYAANVCVGLRFLKLADTAGARHCGRGGTNASGATWCGRPDAPSPHGISDGYNGLSPPPAGAVSLAADESGIRGLSGVGRSGPPQGSLSLIVRTPVKRRTFKGQRALRPSRPGRRRARSFGYDH